MINLCTKIKEYGEIVMIGYLSGERYYWLIKKGKIPIVSMLPASFLEKYYNQRMEPNTKDVVAHP